MCAAFVLVWASGADAAYPTLRNGLRLVERHYLFADQLDPQRLLRASLSYVAARVPELTARSKDDSHLVEAGGCRVRFESTGATTLEDIEPFLERVGLILDRCLRRPPDRLPPTASLLLSGVLSGLDPYSTVFDAERRTEHTIQFRGELAGIGARIGIRDERLTLVTVYPGSPAARAGLRSGDVIIRIDGVSTTNMEVTDAVHRIRGPEGSTVTLEIERAGKPDSRAITVTRGIVAIPSVLVHRLTNGVIYTEITHFSQNTPHEFRERVAKELRAGATPGLLIDLRRNSGGSMLGSSAIADLFLDHGLLIRTAGRDGRPVSGLRAEIRATPDAPFRDLPLAILTSRRTASGSELMAASLRYNDRAVLVGEQTYGKGSVQKTYGLGPESALKLTVGNFLPNGLAIPGGGLAPDVVLRRFAFSAEIVSVPPIPEKEPDDFWLATPPWLTAGHIDPTVIIEFAEHTEPVDDEQPELAEEEDLSTREDDVFVSLAAGLLKRHGQTSAARMLAAARVWLEEQADTLGARLRTAMETRGIDWDAPTAIDTLRSAISKHMTVRIDHPADGIVPAGEKSKMTLTATNRSRGPLYRLRGVIESNTRFLAGLGLVFGTLDAGESRSWTVPIEPPAHLETGRFAFRARIDDGSTAPMTGDPLHLVVAARPQPRIRYRVEVRAAEQAEIATLAVDLRNDGASPARDLRVFLRHPQSPAVELIEHSVHVDELIPNGQATAELHVRLLQTVTPPPELELVVAVPDTRQALETPVVAMPGTSTSWLRPPVIEPVVVIAQGTEETRALVIDVSDDRDLSELWAHSGDRKIGYLDLAGQADRTIRIELPWNAGDEPQAVTVVATDSDGLRSTWSSTL